MATSCWACTIQIGPGKVEDDPPTVVGEYVLCADCMGKLAKRGKLFLGYSDGSRRPMYLMADGEVLVSTGSATALI